MTNFVRYAVIGAIVAGASVYGLAQDAELDALLKGLIEQDQEELIIDDSEIVADDIIEDDAEVIADVAEDAVEAIAAAEEAVTEAEPEAIEEVVAAAEEPVAEVAEVVEDVAEVPEAVEEVAEDVVAEVEPEAPEAVEEVVAAAEEPVAEVAEVAEVVEDVAEVPEAVEEVAEDVVAEVEPETPEAVEEIVAVDEATDALLEDILAGATDEPEAVEEDAVAEAVEDAAEVVEEIAEVDETTDALLEDILTGATDEPEAVEEDTVAEVEPEVEETVEDVAEVEPEAVEEDTVADVEPAEEPEVVPPASEDNDKALIANIDASDTSEIDADTEANRQIAEIDALNRMKNEGLDRYATECFEKAQSMMSLRVDAGLKTFEKVAHYNEAIKMYREALKYLRNHEGNLEKRTDCEKGIIEAYYRQAQTYLLNKEYNEAIEVASKAEKRGHPYAHALIVRIQEEKNKPADIKPTVILPEYAKEEYQTERVTIAERMKRATIYYQLAKYTEAGHQIDLVLHEDPSNEEAIHLRSRLQRRHADYNRNLKLSTHDKMINAVEENWTPVGALGVESEEFFAPQATASAKTPVNDQGKKDAEMIRAKLETIRLPEFTISSNQTIADAAQIFYDMAKLYDKPELPPEERGIAFILNSNATKKAPAASSEEEEDPFAEESSDSNGLKTLPPINMTFVTLKEALDMVCEVSNYKYLIRGRSVMLVPAGTFTEGELVLRKYNVMQDAVQKLVQASNEMSEGDSSGSEDSGGWGVDSGGLDAGYSAVSPAVLKETFINLGVPFSSDAKIFYLSSLGKLYVTNTPENLALVENILEEFNVTPFQIEVEARFVEVSQTDLNSLGFEWRLNGDLLGTIGDGIDWTSNALGGNEVAGGTNGQGLRVFRGYGTGNTGNSNIAVHGGANAINQGTRFMGDSSLYANRVNLSNSNLPIDDTFASFSAVFGELDMTMVLHMLAQRSDTDMLSSPKVLATPDQEAIIRVVTEWIFPTEFEIQELNEDYNNNDDDEDRNGAASAAPPVKFAVEPSSFEKQEVGVKLQVIPRVSPEGQMIQLSVMPQVIEYLGDFEYGMQIPYVRGVSESILAGTTEYEIAYYTVSMPQPKFHFREINTQLSVYNGATVVMGGLITEVRRSFEDKVPVLGDLPFIGFLFRSEGDYSEKRNLLIFLTARLVDPAGRPLKTATDGRLGESAGATPASTTTMGNAE